MGTRRWIGAWPVYRQVAERDWLGLGAAVKSERTEQRDGHSDVDARVDAPQPVPARMR
jgi:formate dehydrogenase major subunit